MTSLDLIVDQGFGTRRNAIQDIMAYEMGYLHKRSAFPIGLCGHQLQLQEKPRGARRFFRTPHMGLFAFAQRRSRVFPKISS
ncbi:MULTISPECIES: hypothetical protein [unclassified Mesorhizobium]|uniref:hypothetical protein n=1 Tax=unclassified Mesorhizobium TaxID=325217 RepID=UPI0013C40C20|nr:MULTISPECIES: hypothetical protein [unclassified Mesorhizobium]